eukprot:gene14636-20671_t
MRKRVAKAAGILWLARGKGVVRSTELTADDCALAASNQLARCAQRSSILITEQGISSTRALLPQRGSARSTVCGAVLGSKVAVDIIDGMHEETKEERRIRKESKRMRKEARKAFEMENNGLGKLWLLHWHQASLEGENTCELDSVVSCYAKDLKRLEKVSKDAVWFMSDEAADGTHILLVTDRPKTAFKYELTELPMGGQTHSVSLPGSRTVDIPLAALRQQVIPTIPPSGMVSAESVSGQLESAVAQGILDPVVDVVGEVVHEGGSPTVSDRDEDIAADTLKVEMSKVEKIHADLQGQKEAKKAEKMKERRGLDLDNVLAGLVDDDPDAELEARRLLGFAPVVRNA